MKWTTGLVLFGSLMACYSSALGGAPEEPKLVHKDGILQVFQKEEMYNTTTKGHPYNYLMKIDVHFGLNFLKPKDPASVGKPGKDFSLLPTCYHHERSPIGAVMRNLKGSPPPYAVVGMHIGAMAAYAKPSQEVHFYENSSKLIELSVPTKGDPYFTYLQDARKRGAHVRVFQGKERETLAQQAPKNYYQVISVEMCLRPRLDDICVEFMTKEGVALLMSKLTETGVLGYHVSNRYFDVTPVLADVAASLGLKCRVAHDHGEGGPINAYDSKQKKIVTVNWGSGSPAHFQSHWIMLAREDKYLPAESSKEDVKAYKNMEFVREVSENQITPHLIWTTPPVTGKYAWTDQSRHLVKGLLHSDPTARRLGSFVTHLIGKLQQTYGKGLDPKTAKTITDFSGQIWTLTTTLSDVAVYLRAESGQTVEDLQKGWPPGY